MHETKQNWKMSQETFGNGDCWTVSLWIVKLCTNFFLNTIARRCIEMHDYNRRLYSLSFFEQQRVMTVEIFLFVFQNYVLHIMTHFLCCYWKFSIYVSQVRPNLLSPCLSFICFNGRVRSNRNKANIIHIPQYK